MITLITGQPGNGKTLHALWLIEKLRKQTGRDVYYWNIKGLTLPWHPMGDVSTFGEKGVEPDQSQALRWYELPDGAIIVMDECQKLLRVRPQGSAVPRCVAEMETHRHKGFDIFLISQNLKQIDTAARVLVGRHVNSVRRFGLESSTLYQWERCADPSSDRDKKEALQTSWYFPKEVYGWYKSAEVHTVKRDFPLKKLGVLALGIVAVVGGIVMTLRHVQALKKNPTTSAAIQSATGEALGNPWAADYRKPRVDGLEQSAPYYDELQKPQSQPTVSGCSKYRYLDGTIECTCTSWQGSVLPLSLQACLNFVKKGWFDPSRPYVDSKQANIDYLNARDGVGQRNGEQSGSEKTTRSM